jgi:hypothetical protein
VTAHNWPLLGCDPRGRAYMADRGRPSTKDTIVFDEFSNTQEVAQAVKEGTNWRAVALYHGAERRGGLHRTEAAAFAAAEALLRGMRAADRGR